MELDTNGFDNIEFDSKRDTDILMWGTRPQPLHKKRSLVESPEQ
jgi:hypothetical protein